VTRTGQLLGGVDVGGSKTDCVICTADGAVLARQTWASAAVFSADLLPRLCAAIRTACSSAGVEPVDVRTLVVGMSGVDTPGTAERARTVIAAELSAGEVIVVNDAAIALEAATSRRPAGALVAGTGSIAYGEDGRHVYHIGGWGPLVGDEGSGLEIAREACAAVLLAQDGRARRTALTGEAMRFFGLREASDLVELTGRFCCEPSHLASFAPQVMATARAGDVVAGRIVAQAAEALTGLGAALARRLARSDRPVPLALAGGVLLGDPDFAQTVRNGLESLDLPIELVAATLPPAFGAVLTAAHARAAADGADLLRDRLTDTFALPAGNRASCSGGAK
jgi:N-acetylglucosamine kinase-like BadF-type ATPase